MAVSTIDQVFRDYVTDGVPSSGAHKPVKADIRDTLNELLPSTDTTAIVIFTSGQSNMANRQSQAWTVPANLLMWNFDGRTDASTVVGTAFAAPSSAEIGMPISFAAEVAKAYPKHTVYLINIARGGMQISNWGTTPPDYNFRQAITGNVPVALAAAGASSIDVFMWWQGESDASLTNNNYISDFNDLHTYFRTQSWWRYETPIVMLGLPEHTEIASVPTPVYANYTSYILGCVSYDPDTRMFVRPSILPAATYWDPAGAIAYIHMNGAGYQAAGRLAFDTWAYGIGRGACQGRIVNPVTGSLLEYGSGIAPAIPAETEEWTFHKNQDGITNFQVKNQDTGAAAQAVFNLIAEAGTLSMAVSSAAGNTQYRHTYGGIGGIGITASHASGSIVFNTGGFNTRLTLEADGGIIFRPPSAAQSLSVNGMLSLEFTNDTTVTFRGRGSDGVTRTATLTLAPP